jgi:hypothetical protein
VNSKALPHDHCTNREDQGEYVQPRCLVIGKEGCNKKAHCAKVDEVSPHHQRIPLYGTFLRCPVASNVLADSGDEHKKEEKPPSINASAMPTRLMAQ